MIEREPLVTPEDLFNAYRMTEADLDTLNQVGHLVLPGLLTDSACERLTTALAHVGRQSGPKGYKPGAYAAEYNDYLESLIGHPQMLELARRVLGEEIRFDHCVALNRPPGNQGLGWHSHEYGDNSPSLGFIRIFFYVNGFLSDDGALKAVPGSHLFRDRSIRAATDADLAEGWMAGKVHPVTGEPLAIETLAAPPGSVVLMWTHAAHAVTPRRDASDTRWCVVFAYRNPGEPSEARWISEAFERKRIVGAEGLMTLY